MRRSLTISWMLCVPMLAGLMAASPSMAKSANGHGRVRHAHERWAPIEPAIRPTTTTTALEAKNIIKAQPLRRAANSHLIWSEEFDGPAGTSPNPNNWNFDTGGKGWGNEELESYTSRPQNAELDGKGDLDITARAESYTGSDGITQAIHVRSPADAAQVSVPVRIGGGAHPGAGR